MTGPIWVVPHPAFPVPDAGRGRRRRRAALRHASATSMRASGSRSSSRRSRGCGGDTRRARLLLVGATSPGFDLDRRLQRLGLDGAGLVREGYVDERRLWELMVAADVHVNLRSPTMGETSGTAIRALSLGKPARRQRRRLVLRAAGRRRAEGPRRRAGGRDARGRARAARDASGRPPRDGRQRRAISPSASTTSSASRSCTSRRSSRPPAAMRSMTRCSAR